MEGKESRFGDDEDEELTTNHIKQKAQEIAKRFEKYQGRYHNTSSSRCNTPLPITSADSIESVHSNSVISDTNEKLILFRKFLENDRKLVENSKIDEQESNNDDEANDDKLLDVQNEKEKHNSTYYDDIISAQFNEKNIHLLKGQVVELNEKLRNYHNIIIEKDVLLQSKIDKIESLNKAATQKDKLHLETVEALNRRNVELYEVISEERLKFTQKINHLVEETDDLKNDLERVHELCDELKEDNIKREKIINELRKVENQLKLDIEQLNINHENEKKLLQQHSHESSRRIIDGMESELLHLHQENDSLTNRIALLESMSMNNQEKDNLLDQLKTKEALIDRLSLENKNLSDQYENQRIEVQQTENRWSQLKKAYLNDKDRMTFLEKVIEELKVNNDDLNNANVKLSEKLEISMGNLTDLKTENSKYQERIDDLMAVIENMREKFETAMKEVSIEYELDKKQLIQQHENDEILIASCNNKLEENTLELNKVTNSLDIVLKENYSYKNKCFELHNCINQNNKEISELKNVITDLNNEISQMNHELKCLKNENATISDKLKNNLFEGEEYKTLSERYLKQKQLLRLKIKALKESENNCSNLQHQVSALVKEVDTSNKKSEDLVHCNEQVNTALQYCGIEIQNCHELLNKTIIKSNVQNKMMCILRCVLMGLASLFDFDNSKVEFDFGLIEIFDSISNAVPDDKELQTCFKKIVIGSINILEYIIDLNNKHKLSKVQLIARTEVDKLVSEAVKRVKLSTQNEYQKQNNELLSLIENLRNDNRTLKLNISSKIIETKEVLTDLNGPVVENLLSLKNLNMKNENDTLKQFLINIREILGLGNVVETDDVQLQYSLSELELLVQEIKNENILLKHQYVECQKLITSKTLEQQIDYQNSNTQNTYVQPVENVGGQEKVSLSLSSEDICMKQLHDTEKSNVTENVDSKILLLRYKNLKSRFKEVRAKTVELDKKIISLTNDLECANSKYKQLNDQFVSANDNHEADIINCQSEIENLMCEKLDAYRQLTTLKEKHEILQNDYDQLKSNLNDNKSVYDVETPTHTNEQITVLKRQLDDTQHLIDSAYSTVLCEWPPIDTSSDWVFVQSRKLDEIVNAKCSSSNSRDNDFDAFDLGESEVQRLKTCVQTIHELVTSVLTNKTTTDGSPTHEIIELMSDLKSCTETFLESISVKNDKLHSADEHRVELSHNAENHDSNVYPSIIQLSSPENPSVIKPLISTEETINPPLSENEDTEQFQRAIAERDRLIQFLSDKISRLDNLNRSVDDIRSIREKLDRALTVVHERDVRCDELTLELTRLLEERDMLQLKLSNSIRQIQFLSDNKPQTDTPNLMEEKYGPRTIDDKLEELHSLEYRRDADLFVDQEHRHKSQMQLHQSHENGSSKTQRQKSSNITEEANTSQSWFKDILW